MKNIFVVAELLDKSVRAILAERVDGKVVVYGSEEESFSDKSVLDENGVLENFTRVNNVLLSISRKMENRAVNYFDNKQVNLTRIDLAVSCFPCNTFVSSNSFPLNPTSTINKGLIDVLKQSNQQADYSNEDIEVKCLNESYVLDGVELDDIQNRHGNYLTINNLSIRYPKKLEDNLRKCSDRCTFSLNFFFSPIMESYAYISKQQMENGIALVSIHSNYSSVVIYNKSKIQHLAVIPFGWNDVNNDLKFFLVQNGTDELKSKVDKINYNDLIYKTLHSDKNVNLKISECPIEVKKIYDVIKYRLKEIFSFANQEVLKFQENAEKEFSIAILSEKEQQDVLSIAHDVFGSDKCFVPTVLSDLSLGGASLPLNYASLLGLASITDDKSAFEVVETVDTEEKPFEAPKKPSPKKENRKFNLFGAIEGFFAGDNNENNE
ncbi:MAG: hypothetical protein ACI3ZZ_04105 [Candidatus Aphodosoma sp.]